MKKTFLLFLFVCAAFLSKADQLEALTKAQAEAAVAYLKKEPVVILWCSCCENQTPKKITVKDVSYKADKDGKYYSVILKGKDESGKDIEEYLDLAYVFVKKEDKAECLGLVLKFECDPCTEPFNWTS